MSVSDDEQWKVGELARATGLTVRALHHYDELGLLVPSERTSAGYRLYGQRDVRRLYRIVALRCLGLRLDEISAVIDGHGLGLGETVARQTEAVDRQLEDLRRVRDRLVAISDVLDRQEKPSIDQLTRTMEAMGVHEKYYTSEQLEQLRQRGDELGHEAIEAAQRSGARSSPRCVSRWRLAPTRATPSWRPTAIAPKGCFRPSPAEMRP